MRKKKKKKKPSAGSVWLPFSSFGTKKKMGKREKVGMPPLFHSSYGTAVRLERESKRKKEEGNTRRGACSLSSFRLRCRKQKGGKKVKGE